MVVKCIKCYFLSNSIFYRILMLLLISLSAMSCRYNANTKDITIKLIQYDESCLSNSIINYLKKISGDNSKHDGSLAFINLSIDTDTKCKEYGYAILESKKDFFYIIPTSMGTSLEIVYSYIDNKDNILKSHLKMDGGKIIFEINEIENKEYIITTSNLIISPKSKCVFIVEEVFGGEQGEIYLNQNNIYILEGRINIRSKFVEEDVLCTSDKYAIALKDNIIKLMPVEYNKIEELKLEYFALKRKRERGKESEKEN